MNRSLLTLCLLCTALVGAAAQDVSQSELDAALRAKLGLVARATEQGVLLRWATDKPAVWRIAARAGFIIERAEAGAGGRIPAASAFRALVTEPIRPWTEAQWRAHLDRVPGAADDQAGYAALAASLLEGDDEGGAVDAEDLAALRQQKAQYEMRYSMALYAADRDAAAADGLGLRYVDTDARRGVTYAYRVRLAGASPVYKVDTGYVVVTHTPVAPGAKSLVRAIENDGWILLTWPARIYGAARIERSSDGGRSFTPITQAPLVTLRAADATDSVDTFADTLVANYVRYTYRVYGATPFADEELAGEVQAMARDLTPPAQPFVPNPKQTAARAVRVVWEMDEPVDADLAGFTVLRDAVESGPYAAITPRMLPRTAREFIDTTFDEGGTNYYIVAAHDTAGNIMRSMPAYVALVDSTSPEPPRWVKGEMDSTGVVRLVLHANRERDVMGYRILRANAADHEFSSVIEWFGEEDAPAARDTVIIDTVAVFSLTPNVYYRATALDLHFNESEMSDILVVKRPDLVPPAAPVITDVDVTDSSVVLIYTPGGSTDVATHLVFKRAPGSDAWGTPVRVPVAATSWTDLDVRKNVTLEYALAAVDSAGNRSELSPTVLARPYDTGVLPDVRDLTARYDADKKETVLRWAWDRPTDGVRFVVYRSVNATGLRTYAVVDDARAVTFTDRSLRGAGAYQYAVKVVARTGAESKLSTPAAVDIK